VSRSGIGLKTEGFAELGGGIGIGGFLSEDSAEFVAQVGAIRIQGNGAVKLGGGSIEQALSVKDAAKRAVSFGILRSKADGFARLASGALEIAFLGERIGKIHAREGKSWIEAERGFKLRDGRAEFALGEKNPSQGVVTFGALRRQLDGPFKSGARGGQVLLPEGSHSLLVGGAGLRCGVVGRGIAGLSESGLCGKGGEPKRNQQQNSAGQEWEAC